MQNYHFKLDPTGYPLVWISAIDAYVGWLPVTKIQFEYFLCAQPDNRFDADWYEKVLALNPRISPHQIRPKNYWQAFMTGIVPSEAESFVDWCGDDYRLPTLEEWFDIYEALKLQPPAGPEIVGQMGALSERAAELIRRVTESSDSVLTEAGYQKTMADSLLMRLGVMEWVEHRRDGMEWGGMGETPSSFHGSLFTPDNGSPSVPHHPEERLYYYGMRIIYRKVD